MKINIFVSAHTNFSHALIIDDTIRKSLLVGAYKKCEEERKDFDYLDSAGENHVSFKNPYYSEISGLYWVWKNDNSEILGFEQYRRLFFDRSLKFWKYNLMGEEKISRLLKKYDIIVANKSIFKDKTMIQQYNDAGHSRELFIRVIDFIKEKDRNLVKDYQKILDDNKLYNHNMFIAHRNIIENYLEWLFEIFENVENDLHYDQTSLTYRSLGFIAERLFTIWLTSRNLKVKEVFVRKIDLSKPAAYNNLVNLLAELAYIPKKYYRAFYFKIFNSYEV